MAQPEGLTHCHLFRCHQSQGFRNDPLQLFLHQSRQNQILQAPWARHKDVITTSPNSKTLPLFLILHANKPHSFEETVFFCTCQRPNFSESFWSPSADWTEGLGSEQTARDCLHLVFCAGQRGFPQEGHRHAAVSGGKKEKPKSSATLKSCSCAEQQLLKKPLKLQRNNKKMRQTQLFVRPEVVGAQSSNLGGIQTADQTAKCCQINSC